MDSQWVPPHQGIPAGSLNQAKESETEHSAGLLPSAAPMPGVYSALQTCLQWISSVLATSPDTGICGILPFLRHLRLALPKLLSLWHPVL